MANARLGILNVQGGTELHVVVDDELWSQLFGSWEDATQFAVYHNWAKASDLAALKPDEPHLFWTRRFVTKPAFLSLLGFGLQGIIRTREIMAQGYEP